MPEPPQGLANTWGPKCVLRQFRMKASKVQAMPRPRNAPLTTGRVLLALGIESEGLPQVAHLGVGEALTKQGSKAASVQRSFRGGQRLRIRKQLGAGLRSLHTSSTPMLSGTERRKAWLHTTSSALRLQHAKSRPGHLLPQGCSPPTGQSESWH